MPQIKSHQPRIVVIGGGTGVPVILKALKDTDVDITAIVTVADDGGSSGILRNYINVVPPGDIRNVIVALSDADPEFLDLFQYRFKGTDKFLAGHAIGNLLITALSEMKGNIFQGVQDLTRIMSVKGHIYPASDDLITLHAEFTDGTKLAGESEITKANKMIERVWVDRDDQKGAPKAAQPVVDAILNADQIVLGPGSLFTSILPNLMIPEVHDAILHTSAEIVYICNIMTQNGETNGFTDSNHVAVLNRHFGQNIVDAVMVNNKRVPVNYIRRNEDETSNQVTHDQAGLERQHCKVIASDFLKLHNHGAYHNGVAVSNELLKLIENN
ncbi:uridine diphosphate-N-acetylglucosamine-binding protein YvcK [Lactobacillus sp. Sy-1]|uniref:gluconeogenesis factor YvcK family protein n=1 Tax=Lactobacillus sp. Sy-1 TaxID=2109645 RepID=UPI001C5AE899|nr:uridine diphosphate-N-acetylglucosamine-binding protein YvcK [Lactobacillus sp. Sy-1]MBW1605952.1 uridine diphosphate-N-acetylglucosamine-binding protein YvcK [Lactobacillus sp. Sy-1]